MHLFIWNKSEKKKNSSCGLYLVRIGSTTYETHVKFLVEFQVDKSDHKEQFVEKMLLVPGCIYIQYGEN